jgi:Extensin-like protein C-terminus
VSLSHATLAALGIFLLGANAPERGKARVGAAHRSRASVRATHRQGPKAKPRAPAHVAPARSLPLQHAPGSRAEEYAALDSDACLAELRKRQIAFVREAPKPGVKIPVRLSGKVRGVLYRTDFPDDQRRATPWEIFDCRLVLSLDDFGETLRAHSIAEVRIFSAWRPPAKSWKETDWARRHQGALAVDVRELRTDEGQVLNVLENFHGKLGGALCSGTASPGEGSPEARELHQIVCAAADAHIFNSILTPNYNPAHKNHFHLELTPDVDWFMVR